MGEMINLGDLMSVPKMGYMWRVGWKARLGLN